MKPSKPAPAPKIATRAVVRKIKGLPLGPIEPAPGSRLKGAGKPKGKG